MWEVTLEARRLFYREVESCALPAIVPSRRQALTVRDANAQRLLYALVDRIGSLEISQRKIQGIRMALASGDTMACLCAALSAGTRSARSSAGRAGEAVGSEGARGDRGSRGRRVVH